MTPDLINALQYLIDMSNSHIEDIDSGIEGGDYKLSDNPDLENKRSAVRLLEAYIESGAASLVPTAVVDIDGGAIVSMMSNVPMKVIFLDEDIESADSTGIMTVGSDEVYVTVKETSHDNKDSECVRPEHVVDVLDQVQEGFALVAEAEKFLEQRE
jgi:hypothetical protein